MAIVSVLEKIGVPKDLIQQRRKELRATWDVDQFWWRYSPAREKKPLLDVLEKKLIALDAERDRLAKKIDDLRGEPKDKPSAPAEPDVTVCLPQRIPTIFPPTIVNSDTVIDVTPTVSPS